MNEIETCLDCRFHQEHACYPKREALNIPKYLSNNHFTSDLPIKLMKALCECCLIKEQPTTGGVNKREML